MKDWVKHTWLLNRTHRNTWYCRTLHKERNIRQSSYRKLKLKR